LQSEKSATPLPLDVLDAESEGMIGYMIEQELRGTMGDTAEIASLLTQVLVDPNDIAFKNPTKPIGPIYTKEEAQRLAKERQWSVGPDGEHWRRMVASPFPQRVMELNTIRRLVDGGVLVICAGGGGIPVRMTETGAIKGVEAVIDKDLSAAMLGSKLSMDGLIMLTDVDAVCINYNKPGMKKIKSVRADELRKMEFSKGSMGPKVQAACMFTERSGGWAAIGSLNELTKIVKGESGTRISNQGKPIVYYD